MLCYVNGIYYSESPQASFILPSISKGRLHPHDSQAHLTPKQTDGPLPLYWASFELSPNLGDWIIFLSEVLATISTIPGSCLFLEINCHRKLFSLLAHISKFHCSAWKGRSICCFSIPLTSNNGETQGCLGHRTNGHTPSRNFLLSDKMPQTSIDNLLFLSTINLLLLPPTLQNNIRALQILHQSPTLFQYLFFHLPNNKETVLWCYQG